MTLEQALRQATFIARIISQGSRSVSQTSINNSSLMAMASILTVMESRDLMALSPRIKEIILFGSAARGEENPGDIDMMVFDTGFYSNVLGFIPPKDRFSSRRVSSWGGMLRNNLGALLEGWFEFPEATCLKAIRFPVDLQVLPISLITDPAKRREVGAKHTDPNFFENAFSTILRFDAAREAFVPTTLDELVAKHLRPEAEEVEDPEEVDEFY